jgi:small basic protein
MTLNRSLALMLVTLLLGPQVIGLTVHFQPPDSTASSISVLARLDESCGCLSASITLCTGSDVSLRLCNLLGQEVASWALGYLPPGCNLIRRLLPNLASGAYFLIAETENVMVVKKLIVVR